MTEYENLDDLLDNNLVEFSLWDPETGERSSSGILTMRHLTTNFENVHDNKWQYVCGSRSDVNSLANLGQGSTCKTMNFNTTVSFTMSNQEEEGDWEVPGYTITCEGENYCYLNLHQKYCSKYGEHGLYQVSCSCNERYQKTAYGCKFLILFVYISITN